MPIIIFIIFILLLYFNQTVGGESSFSIIINEVIYVPVENQDITEYYTEAFFYNWEFDPPTVTDSSFSSADYKNLLLIILIYGVTFALVTSDWRKRKWV